MSEYIEKQAAIKAVCDSCGVMPDGEKDTCPYKYEGAGCREYDKIIDISPADVRPVVRGKWKITSIYIKCLECGECFMLIPQNFCPNCGADMKENKNEKG